jgi:carboxypeptidase C (cathepsin A)
MRSYHACLFAALALAAGAPYAFAQRGPNAPAPAAAADTPVPSENDSVTDHELTLDGKTLRYAATAGNLVIDDDE